MWPQGGAEWGSGGTAGAGQPPYPQGSPHPAPHTVPALAADADGPCFLGRFVHSLDEKRRIALPKAFRDELAERDGASFYLVPGLDPCLWLFTQKRFEAFRRALAHMREEGFQQGHKDVRQLRRDVFSGSTKVTTDKQGRIALPEDACQRVGIEREVVFLGVEDKIELWSPQAEEVRDDPERLRKLGDKLIG